MDGDTVAANPSTAEPEPLEQVNVADPLTIRLSIDDTMKLPVDSERARQDPPTVQIPAYPGQVPNQPATTQVPGQPATLRIPSPAEPRRYPPQRQEPPTESTGEPIGAEQETPDVAVPAPHGGGRQRVVIAALAVGLVGLGAAFGGTSLARLVGFGTAATTAAPATSDPTPQLRPATGGTAPTPDGVRSALAGPAGAPALGRLTGSVVDPATGHSLWEADSATPLTPASAGKLLASAAALLSLDPQSRFTTTVVAGAEPDTVIMVGGGDPTLSSLPVGKESVYPGAPHLDDLVAQVRAAAGGPVHKVLFDVSRYSGEQLAPGWDPRDVAGGSVAPISPLMLDGGRHDPDQSEPPRTATPAADAAKMLAKRLGADPGQVAATTAPTGAKVLGSVSSAPLADLVDNLLLISDNVLAEAVSREVAHSTGAPTTFAGGSQAVLAVLQRNNFDLTGVTMVDGSGLSTSDRVTAKLLSSILAVAAKPGGDDPRTAKLRPLLNGLPVAGGSGTLSDRYRDGSSSLGRGMVRAKTGTLSGVNTLAGVVLDADNHVLVFALMSNGSDTNTGRSALDAVAASLSGCGCH